MLSRKRRDRLTILAQILNIARKKTLKTRIMYGANLSFAQVNHYLSLLQELGFLDVKIEDGKTIYRRTPKGAKYLEDFEKVENLLRKDARMQVRLNVHE